MGGANDPTREIIRLKTEIFRLKNALKNNISNPGFYKKLKYRKLLMENVFGETNFKTKRMAVWQIFTEF